MELSFATKSLRDICENAEIAKRELGPEVSEKLRRRLADIRAAVSVNDLIAGRPYELDGARQRRIAVRLGEKQRLVFGANHAVPPKLESGKMDWSKVSRVKVLQIGSDR
jgi:proteic killer suppression protein